MFTRIRAKPARSAPPSKPSASSGVEGSRPSSVSTRRSTSATRRNTPEPFPENGAVFEDVQVKRTLLGGVKKKPVRRPFQRSPETAYERRRRIQIGIPRVLNIYSTAPIWRTYFEALGIKSENIVFS